MKSAAHGNHGYSGQFTTEELAPVSCCRGAGKVGDLGIGEGLFTVDRFGYCIQAGAQDDTPAGAIGPAATDHLDSFVNLLD
jgi:hypothetical protein